MNWKDHKERNRNRKLYHAFLIQKEHNLGKIKYCFKFLKILTPKARVVLRWVHLQALQQQGLPYSYHASQHQQTASKVLPPFLLYFVWSKLAIIEDELIKIKNNAKNKGNPINADKKMEMSPKMKMRSLPQPELTKLQLCRVFFCHRMTARIKKITSQKFE